MFRLILFVTTGLFLWPGASAQSIVAVSSVWDDSFREWDVHTTYEERAGTLQMRWKLQDDWTEWDFRLADTTADIRMKWKDDPNLWEIRCMGTTVTARTMWTNDLREWRLDDGQHQIVWKARFGNRLDEWVVRDDDLGFFSIYTYFELDPREWIVDDKLEPQVSFAMRLTMICIAILHSVPRI